MSSIMTLKMTEVRKRRAGVGWTTVAFGDVVQQIKDKVDPTESGLERYVAGEHMDTDDLRLRRWGDIGDGYLGPAFHMRFKPGQVLYGSRRTYLRKVAVADFAGITANTTFVLEPKNPNVLLPTLLPFIMQTDAFCQHSVRESKGSVNPYINFSDLAWYEFALPPMEEQRRMARALRACEGSLATLSNLLQVSEVALRSACIDFGRSLLADETIPLRTIESAGDIRMGRQRAPKYQTGHFTAPYLRVANVYDGFITTDDVLEMDFDASDFATYQLIPGDILLNEGQSRELVGRSAIYRGEIPRCCFQNTLIRFRSDEVVPDFGQSFFRFMLYSGRFAALSKQTSSMAHLGLGRFKTAPIRVPDRGNQVKRVAHIVALNQTIDRTRERLDEMRRVKASVIETCMFENER